jgi:hypothetical protein
VRSQQRRRGLEGVLRHGHAAGDHEPGRPAEAARPRLQGRQHRQRPQRQPGVHAHRALVVAGDPVHLGDQPARDHQDSDIKNTGFDCLQRHETGGPTTKKSLRMQELQNRFAKNLNEVVEFYNTRFNIKLTYREKSDLVAFLGSL